jgi:hypothetical protein
MMKMLKLGLTLLLPALLTCTLLSSCLHDDDEKSYYPLVGTVKIVDTNSFYFELEVKGELRKMYPGDATHIRNYEAVAGQRVVIYYELLEQEKTGYDYNARILYLQNILTKNIIPITEATADSIGDDPISIYEQHISLDNEYLTINFQYLTSGSPDKKHMLNLVRDQSAEDKNPDYIDLQFRHNAYDDGAFHVASGLVSFKLINIHDLMSGKKGIRIRVNTIRNEEKFVTINFRDNRLYYDKETFSIPQENNNVRNY